MNKLAGTQLLPVIIFSIIFGVTFVGLQSFGGQMSEDVVTKLSITPVVRFAEDIATCLDNADNLSNSITTTESDFLAGEGTLNGEVTNTCTDEIENLKNTLTNTWKFADGTTLADGLDADLSELAPGEYTLKLITKLEVEGFNPLQAESEKKITIREPEVEGTQTQNQPTATNAPTAPPATHTNTPTPTPSPTRITVNKAPQAVIDSPNNGQYIFASEWDPQLERRYAIVTFKGTGYDSEDGSLGGDSLRWSHQRDGARGATAFGTGNGPSAKLYAGGFCTDTKYTITLKATDSAGASGTDTITLVIQDDCLY